MKLTQFSRGYWEIAVECKASKKEILRDYDIIKMKNDGKTIGQIAIKYEMSERHIINILNKYR